MKSSIRPLTTLVLLTLCILHSALCTSFAQGTLFSYQGALSDNNIPANGFYDFTFALYNVSANGAPLAGPLTQTAVGVTNGLFDVALDFGAQFDGTPHWLEISVSPTGQNTFTTLTPREQLLPTPYAIFAGTASNLSGTLSAGQLTSVGNANGGGNNFFIGSAGNATTTGFNNTAVGPSAFLANTSGNDNTAIGQGALQYNSTGKNNTAEGLAALGHLGFFSAAGGTNNIALGFGAGNNLTGNESSNIDIGNPGVAGDNNIIRLGNGQAITYIASSNFVTGVGNTIQNVNYESTIGGGINNTILANAEWAAIGGGKQNTAGNGFPTVGGGGFNTANGSYATVGGGQSNIASNEYATVAGGSGNIATNDYATVAGGETNTAGGEWAAVGGGAGNTASGTNATVGGGYKNIAGGPGAFIGGGGVDEWGNVFGNNASGGGSFIGGGLGNTNSGDYATIGGGGFNTVDQYATYATIGGGLFNNASGIGAFIGGGGFDESDTGWGSTASGGASVVGGGMGNTASGHFAIVAGGVDNVASGVGAFVGGGGFADDLVLVDGLVSPTWGNNASGHASVIGGGLGNTNNGDYATLGGGIGNTASGLSSTVPGGSNNMASGVYSFAAGETSQATGHYATVGGGSHNQATNSYATVPGGKNNVAGGQYSFAAGESALATHDNSFVWGDGTRNSTSQGANTFNVLATGGVYFYTINPGAQPYGLYIAANGTQWQTISDRNTKKNFHPVDTVAILNKLAAIPIQQWNYKWEKDSEVPNIGPMAQDFKHAFYPGRDDKSIGTLEFDGVELAAIQGLNQKLNEKDAEIQELKKELSEQKTRTEERFGALEKAVAHLTGKRENTLVAEENP